MLTTNGYLVFTVLINNLSTLRPNSSDSNAYVY